MRRADLDPALATRMYAWVSVALRRYIVRNFDVDQSLLDDAIRDSLDTVASEHSQRRAVGSTDERIADRLADTHADDPSVLLDLLRAGEIGLFEVWLLQGALLATPVFASTVVALPMLVDQPVSVHTAVGASWRAVAAHPLVLVLWALHIAVLVALGMALALLGLVVVIPVIAHASWHAHRDLLADPGH